MVREGAPSVGSYMPSYIGSSGIGRSASRPSRTERCALGDTLTRDGAMTGGRPSGTSTRSSIPRGRALRSRPRASRAHANRSVVEFPSVRPPVTRLLAVLPNEMVVPLPLTTGVNEELFPATAVDTPGAGFAYDAAFAVVFTEARDDGVAVC